MLTGHPPWKHLNLQSLVQLHMILHNWPGGPPPMPNRSNISTELNNCLHMCFQKSPIDRPTPELLIECPFLKNGDNLEDSSSFDFLNQTSEDHINHLQGRARTSISGSNSNGQNTPSNNNNTNNNQRRNTSYMDDTSNILEIREKMERILSMGVLPSPRSPTNGSPNNSSGGGEHKANGGGGGRKFSNPYVQPPNLFKPQTPPTSNSPSSNGNTPVLKSGGANNNNKYTNRRSQSGSSDVDDDDTTQEHATAYTPNTKPNQIKTPNSRNVSFPDYPNPNNPVFSVNTPDDTSPNQPTSTTNARKKNPFARSKEGDAYSPFKTMSPEQRQELAEELSASHSVNVNTQNNQKSPYIKNNYIRHTSTDDPHDTVLIDEASVKEKVMNMRSNNNNNYANMNSPTADKREVNSNHERRSGRHAVLGKANSVDDISPRNLHSNNTSPRMTAPSPLARDYYTPTQQAANNNNNNNNNSMNSNSASRNFFSTEIDEFYDDRNNYDRNNPRKSKSNDSNYYPPSSAPAPIGGIPGGRKVPPPPAQQTLPQQQGRAMTANSSSNINTRSTTNISSNIKQSTTTTTTTTTTNTASRSHLTKPGSAGSTNINSNTSNRPSAPPPPQLPTAVDNNHWKCLKCKHVNDLSLHYCDKCATVRGATGRRDNSSGLPYGYLPPKAV